jgi:predicted ATPase
LLHADLPRTFPALRSLASTPNNLPQQLTNFIGREHELAEVAQLLTRNRLLTLLGTGGICKTRLSLQIAADAMDDFPDGVWLVELAALADARVVPLAVASVLGVKEEAGRPVVEALEKFLEDRRLLVILDNCEHLLQGCAELAHALLRTGVQAKILATSREPLRVRGEVPYSVPALAVPVGTRQITPAALVQYPSVRLFVDRATAARPAFQVNERNVAVLAEICRHLDGIPLAIELAAARTRALPVETIAARLGDRFRLLTGGDRSALPREQTLRALIDWSYDLLAQPERALFQRLAVFAGGWTLDTAEAVCAGGGLNRGDVLDLLTALVEKSLVAVDPDDGRYRLLEAVRQFAQERLQESGDQTRSVRGTLIVTSCSRKGRDPGLRARSKRHGSRALIWSERMYW